MATQFEKTITISIKVAPVTYKRIEELREKWKDNRSQTIIRCIEDVWRDEVRAKNRENGMGIDN